MEKWVENIIEILNQIEPKNKAEKEAISNALHVFTYGNGWLAQGAIVKIFFFNDFYDNDAIK